MSLLAEVVAVLDEHDVRYGLIGGVALAAHGVARATLDTDLLVVDLRVLNPGMWTNSLSNAALDIRRGDSDDPLAGLIRITSGAEIVDLIVGRSGWQERILTRVRPIELADGRFTVVDAADLVLLKLYAGGPQDLLDIDLILSNSDGAIRVRVDARIADAPQSARERWRARVS